MSQPNSPSAPTPRIFQTCSIASDLALIPQPTISSSTFSTTLTFTLPQEILPSHSRHHFFDISKQNPSRSPGKDTWIISVIEMIPQSRGVFPRFEYVMRAKGECETEEGLVSLAVCRYGVEHENEGVRGRLFVVLIVDDEREGEGEEFDSGSEGERYEDYCGDAGCGHDDDGHPHGGLEEVDQVNEE